MLFIPTTEKDYLKATKQTAKGRNGRTTTGAKFVSNEKHGETQTRYRRRDKDGNTEYKLIYTA